MPFTSRGPLGRGGKILQPLLSSVLSQGPRLGPIGASHSSPSLRADLGSESFNSPLRITPSSIVAICLQPSKKQQITGNRKSGAGGGVPCSPDSWSWGQMGEAVKPECVPGKPLTPNSSSEGQSPRRGLQDPNQHSTPIPGVRD